jgi:hypothetical protein
MPVKCYRTLSLEFYPVLGNGDSLTRFFQLAGDCNAKQSFAKVTGRIKKKNKKDTVRWKET